MCRWAAYIGEPIFISDIISAPAHSLIDQSRSAEKGKTELNADGFGLAWNGERETPAVFKDIQPAWSNANLSSLVDHLRAPLFLSHVRASTGSGVSRSNCHPFSVGSWSFMHNGLIGGYEDLRKQSDMLIADELYQYRLGTTDSEAMFLIALSRGLKADPAAALRETLKQFKGLKKGESHFRISIAMSDGERIFTFRYASDDLAPTIFYRRAEHSNGWSIVSEPYDQDVSGWTTLPNNSFSVFSRNAPPWQQAFMP